MKILHYSEIASTLVNTENAEGVNIRWLISEEDGAKNFAMRFFEVEAGGKTPLHTHDWEHEVFVISGEGYVWDHGDEVKIKSGVSIFIPSEEKHCFVNTGKEILKFICLIPIKD